MKQRIAKKCILAYTNFHWLYCWIQSVKQMSQGWFMKKLLLDKDMGHFQPVVHGMFILFLGICLYSLQLLYNRLVIRNDCLTVILTSEWLINLVVWHALTKAALSMLGLGVNIFFLRNLFKGEKKSINLSYIFVRIPLIISCEMFKVINIFGISILQYHTRFCLQPL